MRDRDDTGFDETEAAMLRNFFRDEAHAAFETLTRSLLAARDGRPSEDDIDSLLRTTHTLKGSAATVGLNRMSQLAHELEDRFDQLRSGKLEWSPTVADRLTEAIDGLGTVIDSETSGSPGTDEAIEQWRSRLAELGDLGAGGAETPSPTGEETPTPGRRRAATSGSGPVSERRVGDRRQSNRAADGGGGCVDLHACFASSTRCVRLRWWR